MTQESSQPGTLHVAAFYKYVDLPHFATLREPLRQLCAAGDLRGTILLSPEGINGTICGPDGAVQAVLRWLRSDAALSDLEHKESHSTQPAFRRMKVRLKREIMGLGEPLSHAIRQVGEYVDPADWNALIRDPEVLVLDTRNAYEVELGTFEGAVDPGLQHFRAFPEWVAQSLQAKPDTKIAMFCTGGIRCEKASSYLKQQGFPNVYHLKGGILKYLESVDPADSLWRGACFVFDERVALGHGLDVAADVPDHSVSQPKHMVPDCDT